MTCVLEASLHSILSLGNRVPLKNDILQTLRASALRHTTIAILCRQKGNAGARGCLKCEWILPILEEILIGVCGRPDDDADTTDGGNVESCNLLVHSGIHNWASPPAYHQSRCMKSLGCRGWRKIQ